MSPLLHRTPLRNGTGRRRRPIAGGALRLVALTATAAALAGCFTVESTFDIGDDGTADVDFVLLIDTEQLTELAGLFGEDAGLIDELTPQELLGEITEGEDPCADLTSSLTDYDVSVREIEDGSTVGVGCTVSDVPIDELNEIGEDSELVITQDGGDTSFELRLDGVDELAGDTGELPIPGFDLDELFQIRFSATAPGSLSSHNATSTDGATATWVVTADADFVVDGSATMTARWEPGGSGSSSALWIVLIVVGAALVIVAVVLLLRRRGSADDTSTPSGSDMAPPPPPTAPPPPAPGPTAPPPPTSSGAPPTSPPEAGPPASFPPPSARPPEPPAP